MKDIFQKEEGYVVPSNGIEIVNEGNESLLRINITKITMPEDDDNYIDQYECDLYRIQNPMTYKNIVSSIIRSKYSADDVEAIILNQGDENEDHDLEYMELQEWRTQAKNIAKYVIDKIS